MTSPTEICAPCPFCGKGAMRHDSIVHLCCCVDHECAGYVHWWPIADWNKRAICLPAEKLAPASESLLGELLDELESIPTCGDRGELVWMSDIRKFIARQRK